VWNRYSSFLVVLFPQLPFEISPVESLHTRGPSHVETPERICVRRWACDPPGRVCSRLDYFYHLKVYLTGNSDARFAPRVSRLLRPP
jgi:hypothetical protein